MEFVGEILGIREETHDVKTFRIKKPEGFTFVPGQFCMVSFVDKPDLPEKSIPLTFSNSPTDEGWIELTVKDIGEFTKAMFTLKAGDRLRIDGPRGETMNFDESVGDNVVFIAGGSGITPFMSALRYAFAKGLPNRFLLFFGNRTVKDIIFREELNSMSERDNLQIVHVLSCEEAKDWVGECGYVDKEKITGYITEPGEWIWYVCGPPPMVRSMEGMLSELGVPPEKIRIDKWQIPGKQKEE